MEELVYRAIKNKLDKMQSKDKKEIMRTMQQYIDDYLKQFTLYKLETLDLTKPEIDDLILFLLYEIESYREDEKKNLERIYNELYDKHLNGIITGSDLKDVIYKDN